jgi:hypothetical protein
MMIRLLKIEPRVAVGSNMVIGFLTAAVGALSSWWLGGGFDLPALLVVGPPTMLGSYLGARLTGWFSKDSLQRLLGGIIAVMGLVMFGQGFGKLTRARDLQPMPVNETEVRLLDSEDDEWPDWPEPPDFFEWHPEAEE